MSKAGERALKVYPIKIAEREGYDENLRERKGFVKGYHQAEKDNELTCEDIQRIFDIHTEIKCEDSFSLYSIEFYQEVLKRFKEKKGGDV